MTKRAAILNDGSFDSLMEYVAANSDDVTRDRLVFLFSYKAGLRVAEIAGLRWRDVIDERGNIGQVIGQDMQDQPIIGFTVPSTIAKKGHQRVLPLHPALFTTLTHAASTLLKFKGWQHTHIITHQYTGVWKPNTLQKHMSRVYQDAGFFGCSSHSGRRTFVTKAARRANVMECSLMDVQKLAGHKYISTTEAYVDLSPNIGRLVGSM